MFGSPVKWRLKPRNHSPGAAASGGNSSLDRCVFHGDKLAPQAVRIARVRDPEYHEDPDLFRGPPFGLSAIINPEEEAARTMVQRLTISDIRNYFELADGFSLVEAMSIGLPVVAVRSSGASDVVVEGETGFLAGSADAWSIDEAMNRAWESRDSWKEMGLNGRKLVLSSHMEHPDKDIVERLLRAARSESQS